MKNVCQYVKDFDCFNYWTLIPYFNLYVLFFHILQFFNKHNYSKLYILSKKIQKSFSQYHN